MRPRDDKMAMNWWNFSDSTTMTLLGVIAVCTFSIVGLVALWAALGRRHWFLRMAVVVAVIALPLAIPAYDLVLLFAVQSATIVLPLLLWRRFCLRTPDPAGSRLGRTQFLLRDLLLLTALAAVVFSIMARIPRETWAIWLPLGLGGVVLGWLTPVSVWLGLGRRRLWLRLVGVCLLFPITLVAGWLGLARAAGLFGDRPKHVSIGRSAKTALVLLTLAMLLPPALIYYKLLTPRPIPETVLPDPNAYGEIVQAAQALPSVDPDAPTPTLRTFLAQNRTVLDAAHAALQRPCQVPLRYESDFDGVLQSVLVDMQASRNLARAFCAEAILAKADGRTADAVRCHLDQLRLGKAVGTGGLMVETLVGWGLDGIGVAGLAEMRESLTAAQCHELIDTLQQTEAEREPLQDIVAREEAWEDRVSDWLQRIVTMVERVRGSSLALARENAAHICHVKMQLLIGELALRCYRLERGKPAEELSDLIPDYLPAVPIDPFTGNPLIYRQTPKGHVLYSVGPDGCDDGGRQPDYTTGVGGDLLLDEPPKPQIPPPAAGSQIEYNAHRFSHS